MGSKVSSTLATKCRRAGRQIVEVGGDILKKSQRRHFVAEGRRFDAGDVSTIVAIVYEP